MTKLTLEDRIFGRYPSPLTTEKEKDMQFYYDHIRRINVIDAINRREFFNMATGIWYDVPGEDEI